MRYKNCKQGSVTLLGIEIGHWWQVYHVPVSVSLRVQSERKERPLNEARTCLERQTGGDWKRAWLPLIQTLNQLHLHTHSSARTGSTCTQALYMTLGTESNHIWPGRHHSQSTVVPYTSPLIRSIVLCQTWFVFVCWQHWNPYCSRVVVSVSKRGWILWRSLHPLPSPNSALTSAHHLSKGQHTSTESWHAFLQIDQHVNILFPSVDAGQWSRKVVQRQYNASSMRYRRQYALN